MANRIVYLLTLIVIALELMAFSAATPAPEAIVAEQPAVAEVVDYNDCIVKVKSEWEVEIESCVEYDGYKATFKDTYQVTFQNTCDETLDVMVAIREADLTWNCKVLTSIAKDVEFSHYACKGVGKYMRWTRLAGDKSVVFPTPEEVNKQYAE